jgi:hypothetical protein
MIVKVANAHQEGGRAGPASQARCFGVEEHGLAEVYSRETSVLRQQGQAARRQVETVSQGQTAMAMVQRVMLFVQQARTGRGFDLKTR